MELKPCPFCGNDGREEPIIIQKKNKHPDFPYRVKCTSCGAKADYCRTVLAAVNCWNRRTDNG
jgi:Lar family restriction alleviation protein